jgi:hypothetical protein
MNSVGHMRNDVAHQEFRHMMPHFCFHFVQPLTALRWFEYSWPAQS